LFLVRQGGSSSVRCVAAYNAATTATPEQNRRQGRLWDFLWSAAILRRFGFFCGFSARCGAEEKPKQNPKQNPKRRIIAALQKIQSGEPTCGETVWLR
jgi:hypothetical protein